MNDVRGIIFDLDGTLTDYAASAESGLQQAYQCLIRTTRNIPYSTFKDTYNRVLEQETAQTSALGIMHSAEKNRSLRFKDALRLLGLDFKEEVILDMAKAYGIGRYLGAVLMPDVHPVLHRLHQRYLLGLLTEGSDQTQRPQLEKYGLLDFFSAVIISGNTPFHKPNPALFRMTAEALGISSTQIAMVGDRVDWDLKPAKSLGMRTVLFQPDLPGERKFREIPDVDFHIHHFKQLLELF